MGGGAVFINASEMCHTAPAKSASWVVYRQAQKKIIIMCVIFPWKEGDVGAGAARGCCPARGDKRALAPVGISGGSYRSAISNRHFKQTIDRRS